MISKVSKSRFSKKAQEESGASLGLVSALLITIALILVITIFFKDNVLNYVQGKNIEEQTCRNDILAHSSATKWSAGTINTLPNCKPLDIKINPLSNSANKELADAMMFCQERWQFGKLELFPDISGKDDYGIYCNPCAHIEFTNYAPMNNFFDYLYGSSPDGYSSKYIDLLKTYNSPGAPQSSLQGLSSVPVLTNTDYLVIFVYAKGESSIGRLKDNFNKHYARNFKKVAKGTVYGAIAGGVVTVAVGLTAIIAGVFSGGVGTVVVLGAAGGVAGASAGGYLTYFFGDAVVPVWVSEVLLVPNNAETFLNIGCQATYQGKKTALKDV